MATSTGLASGRVAAVAAVDLSPRLAQPATATQATAKIKRFQPQSRRGAEEDQELEPRMDANSRE
jgi:hypothetical protein